MRVVINGVIYDSTKTPILIEFDENEQKMFNMKKFVSAPPESTEQGRQELIEQVISCSHPRVSRWNHGYHSICLDCGEEDV